MPQFNQGEAKTARITMRNPKGVAFDYTGFLYIGATLVAETSFRLNAGEEKLVAFSVTMPSVTGTYPVLLYIYSGGRNIALYRATEDVTIVSPVPAVRIMGASWTLIDYPFVGYWPEETGPLKAVFCKGELQVNSDIEFVGSAVIICPSTIAPVRLLTAYGYQKMMAEIDALIASTTGATQQQWINRKAIALTFPRVDEFTIDYRWLADFDRWFRDWVYGDPTGSFTLNNVYIPEGTSTVKVGFFAKYGAAVGLHPATISLYSDEKMLTAVESDLVPPGTVPQLLGVSLPQSVRSGGEIPVTMTLRLPPQTGLTALDYYFALIIGSKIYEDAIAQGRYASPAIVNTRLSRGCIQWYLPLDAPDNVYTIGGIWTGEGWVPGKAVYYTWMPVWAGGGYYTPLPPGIYPISLLGVSWLIGVEAVGCGLVTYSWDPVARYDFGVVGYIQVT